MTVAMAMAMSISTSKLWPPLSPRPYLAPPPSTPLLFSRKLPTCLSPPISCTSSSSMSAIIAELKHGKQDQEAAVATEEQGEEPPRDGRRPPWRKLAGEDEWSGLLDPLDPYLREELLRYGDMAQACYDAFDYDPFSVHCGSCKYARTALFRSLALPAFSSHDVTRYLYATFIPHLPSFLRRSHSNGAWSELANWVGFVAVSPLGADGRRDIIVAWRGTVTRLEWLADLTDILRPVSSVGLPCPDRSVCAESGFLDFYTGKDPSCPYSRYSAREQVLAEVRRLVHLYHARGEDLSISVTGHSLGSALATLCAYDIAETGVNVVGEVAVPVCVYSFSSPRVGNRQFKDRFEKTLGVKALRVVNVHDGVPKVPGVFSNERLPAMLAKLGERLLPCWSYKHVGVELQLDHRASPFLKDTADPTCTHNLEACLHVLDGYHGKGRKFEPTSGRDHALVNKACDFLKVEYLVPPKWRQDENRGMVKKEGRWRQVERERVDHGHSHDEMLRQLAQIGIHLD